MLNFDKYCLNMGFLYLLDSKGKFISEFAISQHMITPLLGTSSVTGSLKSLFGESDAGISQMWPTAKKYRVVEDPISIQTLRCVYADMELMEKDNSYEHVLVNSEIAIFFHSGLKEMRGHPITELSPYGGNYVGNQKFKTDLHSHITTKHLFKLGQHWGKTKLEILLKDPISGEKVDGTYNATVKIEKLFDGFPELLQEKEDIVIKNGVCEYEFDVPTTECNVFFKVKPQKEAWRPETPGEHVPESNGYNINKHISAFTYRN